MKISNFTLLKLVTLLLLFSAVLKNPSTNQQKSYFVQDFMVQSSIQYDSTSTSGQILRGCLDGSITSYNDCVQDRVISHRSDFIFFSIETYSAVVWNFSLNEPESIKIGKSIGILGNVIMLN